MNVRSIQVMAALFAVSMCQAQTDPEIVSWLQNTTVTGTYYVSGNSTALENNILVNCQEVEYSDDFVYVHTTGVPAYPTGPFQDGNPSVAQDQSAIYKINRNPEAETPGQNQGTTPGTIGVFVNGVALFDYRDGVAWNPNTNSICGGPGNPPCPGGMGAAQDWNRDAIPAEMGGFDCAKAHPANGTYHHHQNPSAFDLDQVVLSDICNMYDSEGLYAIDETAHSPLIGFAYDSFPIYGAYGYANADGSGGVTRIKSGYQLGSLADRSTYPDGSASAQGPSFTEYFRGYFREDNIYVEHPGEEDYLDEHNGRMCVTPEYPDGTYAYFATVDEDWNSVYPYVIGPSFYGVYTNALVTSVSEPTTVYEPVTGLEDSQLEGLGISIFPNPSSEFLALQISGLLKRDLNISVYDIEGKLIQESKMNAGTTIWFLDTRTLYSGQYLLDITDGVERVVKQVAILK